MYSWYPHCTHDISPVYWTSPGVLHRHYAGWNYLEIATLVRWWKLCREGSVMFYSSATSILNAISHFDTSCIFHQWSSYTLKAPGFLAGVALQGGGGLFSILSLTPLCLKLDYSNFVQKYFGIWCIFCDKESGSDHNDVTMTSSLLCWVSKIAKKQSILTWLLLLHLLFNTI